MKSSVVIAMITGRSCGSVIVRNRWKAVAPSTAAASCRSSRIDWSPASSATVVWGIPAQTPTRITAGSAQVKLESQSVVSPGMWVRRRISFRIPACGWKKSFHMIPTTTAGIAHGTRASERASQRPFRSWLRRRARPSAKKKPINVTATDQIRPILNDLTKSSSSSRARKLSSPMKFVVISKPACASVKPR